MGSGFSTVLCNQEKTWPRDAPCFVNPRNLRVSPTPSIPFTPPLGQPDLPGYNSPTTAAALQGSQDGDAHNSLRKQVVPIVEVKTDFNYAESKLALTVEIYHGVRWSPVCDRITKSAEFTSMIQWIYCS